MTDIDEDTKTHAATMEMRDEISFLRSELDASQTSPTPEQSEEIQRLKGMLGEACDLADRLATDRGDRATISRLRKAAAR